MPAKTVVSSPRAAGSSLEHLALSFRDVRLFKNETPDLLLKQMRLFAREILPAFRT